MEETRNWLIQWFVDNANGDEKTLRENMAENYFDKGFIDSFTFISLIAEIEENFQIEFDNEHMSRATLGRPCGTSALSRATRFFSTATWVFSGRPKA